MAQDLFESAERHRNMQFEWYREYANAVRLKSEAGFLFAYAVFRLNL